jgi:hypothetical protein
LSGVTKCTNCSAGLYSAVTGVSQCTACSGGTFSTSGSGTSAACTLCASGRYSGSGATSCIACPAGKRITSTPSTSCTNCQAGYYSGASSGACSSCAAGFYSGLISATCSACPAGTYSSTAAATSKDVCMPCPSGLSSSVGASSCTSCQNGQYITDTSICQDCRVGTYGNDRQATVCMLCPENSYSDSLGASVCKTCSEGKFSSPGSTACGCPAGSLTNASNLCEDCLPGKFSVYSGLTQCTQCDVGRYASSFAKTECKYCSTASYSTSNGSTSCEACPEASTSTVGATSISDCSCKEGYFQRDLESGFDCVKCPDAAGLKCGDKWANVTAGYFWKPGKTDSFQCIPPAACQESMGSNGTTCAPLYHGDNCGACIVGVSYRSNNECKLCPSSWTRFFIGAVLVVLFAFMCYRISKRADSASVEFKIVFLSIQLIASFSSFYSKWPPVFGNLLSFLSFSVCFGVFF